MIALYIYVGSTLMVALSLSWQMVFRLDRFDWRYGGIWESFWLTLLLWPLLLLKPKTLLKGLGAWAFGRGPGEIAIAARERELDRLRRYPPPCGTTIRFQHQPDADEASELLFLAKDVERALCNPARGQFNPDVLRWVRLRDSIRDRVTDVPAEWWQFQDIAVDLVEQGHGVVRCGACGRETAAQKLMKQSSGGAGHTFHMWQCTCGRKLLQVDGTHFHF